MKGTDFFDALLTLRGLNPNSLARAINHPTAQSGFDRFRKGIIQQPRRSEVWDRAAEALGVNPLAFHDESIAAQEWARVSAAAPNSAWPPLGALDGDVVDAPPVVGMVPLISWVKAGEWSEAADPWQPGDAEDWLPCIARHSPSTYALRVRGQSMTAPHGRSYPEGSIIFVDPANRMPTNGQRVIARLEQSDEVTFKVYKNEDGRQWLMPLNPTHPPIFDRFSILGVVIGMWIPD